MSSIHTRLAAHTRMQLPVDQNKRHSSQPGLAGLVAMCLEEEHATADGLVHGSEDIGLQNISYLPCCVSVAGGQEASKLAYHPVGFTADEEKGQIRV
jgi:hypothetical protein